jgi:uncharacterized protein YoxC
METETDAVPEWAKQLQESVNEVHATLNDILEKVADATDQVTPMIEKLQNHPLAKMFGVKS